jgi:LPXTG-site transpeptidase (sortase) family protein
MIRERRGPRRSAALSVVRQTVASEAGLGRWAVLAMGGVVVFLVAVVILLQSSHLMPGTSEAKVASTTPTSGTVTTLGTAPTGGVDPSAPTTPVTTPHPIMDPFRIVIPAIGVDAKMVYVGIQHDGTMDVPPYGLAAWYKGGAAPGAPGPAVIIGHVDSKKKPDVFHRLGELKAGDLIMVYDRSGNVATFQADTSELVLKTKLPVDRVWNKTTQPVLRLITCGGKWDASIGHYLSNLIVYCHLVK